MLVDGCDADQTQYHFKSNSLETTMNQISSPHESNDDHSTLPSTVLLSGAPDGAKKVYTRPELFAHGDLRSLTFGRSPGAGESGTGFTTTSPDSWS